MSRKRYTAEQIIVMLPEVEIELSRAQKLGYICRNLGITEQTKYRWRREYGGMKGTQARRIKQLDEENRRPKQMVAELSLDKHMLQEVLLKKL